MTVRDPWIYCGVNVGTRQEAFDALHIYVLVILLYRESRLRKLQSKLVRERKLQRYRLKVAKSTQGLLFKLWVNTLCETATHRCFSRDGGKYMPLLSRLFSIQRQRNILNINKSILAFKNVVVMSHTLIHTNIHPYIDATLKCNLGSEGGISCLRMVVPIVSDRGTGCLFRGTCCLW